MCIIGVPGAVCGSGMRVGFQPAGIKYHLHLSAAFIIISVADHRFYRFGNGRILEPVNVHRIIYAGLFFQEIHHKCFDSGKIRVRFFHFFQFKPDLEIFCRADGFVYSILLLNQFIQRINNIFELKKISRLPVFLHKTNSICSAMIRR